MHEETGSPPKPPGTTSAADRAIASDFLGLLGRDEAHTFQTFGEAAESGRRPELACVLHGSFEQHQKRLEALNRAGAGVFVMVSAGDGVVKPGAATCRTMANVVRVRAVFLDLDGAPIRPVLTSPLPPDWVVQSSPGRWHAYWKVLNCPLGDSPAAQVALARKFGGDQSVKDLPRVMRLPGFFHLKAQPYLSQLYLPETYPALLGETRA